MVISKVYRLSSCQCMSQCVLMANVARLLRIVVAPFCTPVIDGAPPVVIQAHFVSGILQESNSWLTFSAITSPVVDIPTFTAGKCSVVSLFFKSMKRTRIARIARFPRSLVHQTANQSIQFYEWDLVISPSYLQLHPLLFSSLYCFKVECAWFQQTLNSAHSQRWTEQVLSSFKHH